MHITLEIFLTLGWTAFFLFLISQLSFFQTSAIPKRWFQGVFVLKILFGLALWAIYTFYYTDRFTADIYKYFDDSKPMFDAFFTKPKDFFQMLFGFRNDSLYFNRYYSQMNNWFREYASNLYNDSHTIIRFNAVVRFFSLGCYNVHTVFMCFFSLLGLTGIYKTLEPVLKDKSRLLFAAVFLLPSDLFWGSGVLKEGLLFFGLGFLIWHFHQILAQKGRLLFNLFWLLFSVLLLAVTKFYILAAIIPGLLANMWLSFTGNRKAILKYAITFGIFITLALGLHNITRAPNPLEILTQKQKDFLTLVKGGTYLERKTDTKTDTIYIEAKYYSQLEINRKSKTAAVNEVPECWILRDSIPDHREKMIYPNRDTYRVLRDYGATGSDIKVARLEPDLWSFIKAFPRAFYNSFFRPWLFESSSPFILMAGLENTAILLFLIYVLLYGSLKQVNWKWFLFCFSFFLILYILTGWVTPVLGAVVRYRIPGMPFLLIAATLTLNPRLNDMVGQASPKWRGT